MEKIILEKPWILLVLAIWIIPWKGMALWRAARNGHRGWFVILIIFNTLALLEIIYLLSVGRKKDVQDNKQTEAESIAKIVNNLKKPRVKI